MLSLWITPCMIYIIYFQVPSPQQYPVLMYGMLSIHQWLGGFRNSLEVVHEGSCGQELLT